MTGLIPMYIKTAYKKEPVFSNCKVIYTIGQNTYKEKMGKDFVQIATINANVKDKDMDFYNEGSNTAMFRGGAHFADAITFGAEKIDKKLLDEFSKVRGKKILKYNPESDLSDYLQLYADLEEK
jgi:starch synthase